MIFETERLVVRELTLDDLPAFILLEGNPNVVRYTGYNTATPSEAKEDLFHIINNYTAKHPDKLIWAAVDKENGSFIGTVALVPFNQHTLEIGYRLLEEYWNQGFASELCPKLIEFGLTFDEIDTIYAEADVQNVASIQILERNMEFTSELYNDRLNCVDRQYKLMKSEA